MSEPSQCPSSDVIARIKVGDSDALNRFLARHRERLKSWLSFGLGMPHGRGAGASDVVQDAFLEVAIGITGFRGHSEEELLAWVRRILRNRVVDLSRKRALLTFGQFSSGDSTDSDAGLPGQFADDVSSPSQQVIRDESAARRSSQNARRTTLRNRQIRDAAEKLSSEQLLVVLLHEIDGVSLKEIASRLGSKPAAVARQFLEGRQLLRQTAQWRHAWRGTGASEAPRERMHMALESLPPRQRDAVFLQHLEGFSMEETAAVLETSPAAVGSAVYRGILALKEALGRSSSARE